MHLKQPVILAVAALLSSTNAFSADEVEKVVVRSVAHFGFDHVGVAPPDQSSILSEVGKLKNVTWLRIVATGHTDSVGRPGYNSRLSLQRAAAVKSYLVTNGIDASMVRTEGRAAKEPIASNDTEDGRAQNRRAEIEFQGVRPANNVASK